MKNIHSFVKQFLFLSLGLLPCCLHLQAAVTVVDMKVSGLVEPLAIDQDPTFSWKVESDERGFYQKSYHIIVTDATGQTLWDSGNVASSAQSNISYKGAPLSSCSAYEWTVQITGQDDCASDIGKSTFETTFLDESEWTAKWIGNATDLASKDGCDLAANFPASYTLQSSDDNQAFSVRYTAVNADAPAYQTESSAVPEITGSNCR